MAEGESLGKARLDLTADLADFEKNVREAESSGDSLKRSLEAIVAAGDIAERQLNRIRMSDVQAAESRTSAEAIISGVRGISEESVAAAAELDRVRLTDRQAAESKVAAEGISEGLDQVSRNADQAKRKLEEVRLAGGGGRMIGGTSLSLLGAGIGAAALLAPAAGPGMLGLLAALPALATTAGGALGTLMLAFQGVGKAISGDKTAFEKLVPAQQQFVLDIRSLEGELDHLEQIAARNLFPGLDEALHSALSPGTLGLVDRALAEFGQAIGQAGEQWGRYFGSAEFQQTMGPLLKAGAQGLETFSTVALHLADALLTLGRDAIPFLDWLGQVTEHGSTWLDQLIREKSATGALSSVMNEAKTSLTLVGNVIESLGRVLGSLGEAIYPVSKVAVKDLTDGLDYLAGVIQRNEGEIRQIVGGALAALVTVLRIIVPIIGDLFHGLEHVVDAMGGWQTAFEIVLGGLLAAKFVALGAKVGGFSQDVAAAAVKVAEKLGLVAAAEDGVGVAAGEAAVAADGAFASIGAAATVAVPYIAALVAAIAAAKVGWDTFQGTPVHDAIPKAGSGNPYPQGTGDYEEFEAGRAGKPVVGPKGAKAPPAYRAGQRAARKAKPPTRKTQAVSPHVTVPRVTAPSASPFGKIPPWTSTSTGGSGGGSSSTHPASSSASIPDSLKALIQHTKDEAAETQGVTAEHWLEGERTLLEDAKRKLTSQLKGASPKQKTAIDAELRKVNGQITSVNVQITANLKAQAAAIKQNYSAKLSSAKSAISSAMSELQSALDTQFENQTQNYIDTVLGPKYFQGANPDTGAPLQTPLEAQSAAMQAQDQATSLNQALAQAQAQLVADRGSGADAATVKADEEAVAQAQRQITENNLAIEATRQRQQADADYAKAVQQYQDQRSAAEKQMNDALTASGGNLKTVAGIAKQFGVSLTDTTTGAADAFSALESATTSLAGVMLNEAAALAAVGDKKDATAIRQQIASLGAPSAPSESRVGTAPDGTVVLPGMSRAMSLIGMADGGIGRVTMPTLFYSAGDEDFAFSGEGRSFHDLAPAREGDIVLVVNDQELARANAAGLSHDRHAAHLTARAVKPALGRVTAISK